jgi:parvulin-like peptidyl-prolyl isomerase
MEQIDAVIDKNPAFAQMKREAPANIDVLRKNVTNRLINRALLLAHAVTTGNISNEDVKANVAKVVKGYGGKAALEDQLKRMGSTYSRFIEDIETDFQINSFIENKIVPGIVVSEEELRKTFAKDPQNYASPETVRARHILLTLGQNASEEEISKAHEKLLKIRRKALSGEVSFENLAKKYSEGPTAANGGDLGSFPRGRMVPEFERVAFALPTGSISEPVRSQFGLHLIKVEAHHKPKPPTFEQARPVVEKILTKKKADAEMTALVEELRRRAKVEIKL